MPGDMPYYLEKGPYLTGIEKYLSVEGNAVSALNDLRNNKEIPDIGGVLDNLGGPLSPQQLKDVIYRDWFGRSRDSSSASGWGPQDPFHWASNPTTGYWQQYYGDVEKIVRETLIRAIEVSLGLDYGEKTPSSGQATKRHWPVELWWKCGQGWFEGWVTWHNDQHENRAPARDAGQVTVVLATPGTGYQVLVDPTMGRHLPHFEVDPPNTRRPGPGERFQGSWVVTHNVHDERAMLTSASADEGQLRWPVFGTGYVGTKRVLCVQPSWADGGTQS
jgi:hypothetical protein